MVKRARDTKGVEVRTGNYNVWPNTGSKGKIAGWRGQGEVILESKDFEAAAALASKLSDKTAISSISFSLSRCARGRGAQAAQGSGASLQDRALAAANAFGFSGYRLSKLELGGSGGPGPMPRMMAMAKDAGAAPPTARTFPWNPVK